VLRGVANFYRIFIQKSSKVTALISNLLKTQGSRMWEWTRDAELAFPNLYKPFPKPPILQHFNLQKPIILQTNATSFAIARILNQYDGFRNVRLVNLYARKWSPGDQNYDTYDREHLAIVQTQKQWRHYLHGVKHKVLSQCDNRNLEYFQPSKVLSGTQARWVEILSS
jgi:hypothetical protein